MPACLEPPPLNPFAAELRRAAAGAAAPDKAPSLRELSSVSGVGRSAIGDWLAGKSLPRSWDDGAVLVVDAIIKLAARYGKRFADEEAVRQRCKDAYDRAKNPQHADSASGSGAPVPGIDAAMTPAEAAPRSATDDRLELAEPGPETSPIRWWRTKYAVLTVAIFAVLTAAVALILLPHPTLRAGPAKAKSECLDRSTSTAWGAGEIHVCTSDGQGRYSSSTRTTTKTADGSCVRWRIVWGNNKPDTYIPEACPQESLTFNSDDAPAGVSGVRNAVLEIIQNPR